nr:DUF2975 domain-containing protein [Cellulosimicrobium sp. MM]
MHTSAPRPRGPRHRAVDVPRPPPRGRGRGAVPEVRSLVVPYSVLAVLALLAVEVARVAVWRLLGLAARDEVFDPRALRSVTVVIGCVVTVAILAATVFGHLTFGAQLGGPLVLLGLLGSLVGGGALALLVVVLRALLRAATADRRELAAVI